MEHFSEAVFAIAICLIVTIAALVLIVLFDGSSSVLTTKLPYVATVLAGGLLGLAGPKK